MIGRARHLREDRLYECYLSAQAGETLDPRTAEHLADCSACQARYAELEGFLEVLRGEAEAETDELFTVEQLVHQKDQILRKVEHLHRAARVISFPGGPVPQTPDAVGRVAPRWLAAAAAAGLLVGVAVGSMFDRDAQTVSVRTERPAATVPAPTAPRVTPQPAVLVTSPAAVDPIDDDLFLSQLEMALARPRARELQPFDALTPRVRGERRTR